MDSQKPRTTAVQTSGMPPGIPYIIGNEAAERFSFYGMRAILAVYMTKYLRDRAGHLAVMSEDEAGYWYHTFLSVNYFLPTIGAVIADSIWGKYRTIFWLSIVYCFGHFALSLDDTRFGLACGLGLIAVGAGGIKPCVSANVGDQFSASNQHLISKAFGWFYFSVNFGSTFSILLIPWLLEHYGPGTAFAVPGILMAIATVIFWLGRRKFVHVPPGGRQFFRNVFNWVSVTALAKLAVVFSFVAVFWALWDQSGDEWVLQAGKMDLHFLGINWLPSQVQAVNAVMILAFIPLFQYGIYPLVSRVFPLTPLRKIGIGLVVTGLSFVVSAWIERQLGAGLKPSVGWQLPAYALLSAGEIMVSITSLEFAYTQSPKTIKSIVMSLYLLSISAGNAFAAHVHEYLEKAGGSMTLSGSTYYLLYAGLACISGMIFAVVAVFYKERTFSQDAGFPEDRPPPEAAPVA